MFTFLECSTKVLDLVRFVNLPWYSAHSERYNVILVFVKYGVLKLFAIWSHKL